MDEKKLHSLEFQLKRIGGNMRCKKNKSRFFTFCATVIPLDIKRKIESWEKVNTNIKFD